jgi:hypothetical protein
MVGVRGFSAQFALIVTWERMGYGGQPKFLRLDQCKQFKKWVLSFNYGLFFKNEVGTFSLSAKYISAGIGH